MPDLIRHPDVVPTKVGNHLKDWVPVFTGNPGFRLSPERRLSLNQAIYGQTLNNPSRLAKNRVFVFKVHKVQGRFFWKRTSCYS